MDSILNSYNCVKGGGEIIPVPGSISIAACRVHFSGLFTGSFSVAACRAHAPASPNWRCQQKPGSRNSYHAVRDIPFFDVDVAVFWNVSEGTNHGHKIILKTI